MDELPELPFEQVLSYLNLEDRLKLRIVSRSLYQRIDSFRVSSLCFSVKQSGFIYGKSRWVSGAFARNFISSTRFAPFFDTFGQTILSNLKRLRLCDLDLSRGSETALARILNSFAQLEHLDITRLGFSSAIFGLKMEWNLPMLHNIHLGEMYPDGNLILDAPRLKRVKISKCYNQKVKLVHGESVERLIIYQLECEELENLRNLQYLNVNYAQGVDSTFLPRLKQLKEVHLQNKSNVLDLFEQKQRYGRAELKIYYGGLLLSGPEDPAIPLLDCFNQHSLLSLAENPSALSDEIPFCYCLCYQDLEPIGLGLEMSILEKFTDLKLINVNRSVQDTKRFLNILKNLGNIEELRFLNYDQPQDLFDRLPEHSAVQKLTIFSAPSDYRFLFRMKHLIELGLNCSVDTIQTFRKILEKLSFLSHFHFWYDNKFVSISRDLKLFRVSIDLGARRNVADLHGSIQFIEENLQDQGANSLE